MKYTTYIARSKDGYITDKNGTVDFLNKLDIKGDAGYKKYYDTIDAIIFGSKTYKFIKAMDLQEWPYKGKKCFVLTSHPNDFEEDGVIFYNGTIKKLEKILPKTTKKVWVMGGANVINQYINAKMIDEMIISNVDVLLEDGIALFENERKITEQFKITKTGSFGDVVNEYYSKIKSNN